MADRPNRIKQVEIIPSLSGEVSALASANAPFLFFDGAPVFGMNNGIVNMSLEAARHTLVGDQVLTDRVVVAHLRTSLVGLQQLKKAIEGIELLARASDGGVN
jgi:predicted HAD superfamily phosphohydrolase YqeG